MKTTISAAAAAAAAVLAGAAAAQIPGNWVLAPWHNGDYLFPGVVTANAGGRVTVRFDDGTSETMASTRVEPFTWTRGSRVECRWHNGQRWYSGRVETMAANGANMSVRYDDDHSLESTVTARCRAPAR